LDELIIGVLQFEEPDTTTVQPAAEMVFYQPTPARHIFDLLERTALIEDDMLVDIGSGLGHVPMLTSICTKARSVGIELEPAYVDCAQQAAESLNLSRVTFIQQDARSADFSNGTVFYLYTPFTGAILRATLELLRQQAKSRPIRICTFGPCTLAIAAEDWVDAISQVRPDRISIFRAAPKRVRRSRRLAIPPELPPFSCSLVQ
jgi:Histone methylation protein DOT1